MSNVSKCYFISLILLFIMSIYFGLYHFMLASNPNLLSIVTITEQTNLGLSSDLNKKELVLNNDYITVFARSTDVVYIDDKDDKNNTNIDKTKNKGIVFMEYNVEDIKNIMGCNKNESLNNCDNKRMMMNFDNTTNICKLIIYPNEVITIDYLKNKYPKNKIKEILLLLEENICYEKTYLKPTFKSKKISEIDNKNDNNNGNKNNIDNNDDNGDDDETFKDEIYKLFNNEHFLENDTLFHFFLGSTSIFTAIIIMFVFATELGNFLEDRNNYYFKKFN